jgi:Holliday junction resolvasome RuvABC endonuclease subunit
MLIDRQKIILCVDPGICDWAYAVFDEDGILLFSRHYKYTSKESQESRMFKVFDELDNLEYSIEHVVVERQFVDIMAQIVGVIRAFAGKKGVKTTPLVPSKWRKLLTGKGNATEVEVKDAVVKRYPQMESLSVHEVDCAALYLAYKGIEHVEKPIKSRKRKKLL